MISTGEAPVPQTSAPRAGARHTNEITVLQRGQRIWGPNSGRARIFAPQPGHVTICAASGGAPGAPGAPAVDGIDGRATGMTGVGAGRGGGGGGGAARGSGGSGGGGGAVRITPGAPAKASD